MRINKLTILLTMLVAVTFVACSSSSKKQIAPMKLFPIADGEKFGYADIEGNIVIQPQFDRAYMFRDGVALVGVGTGNDTRWGYVKEDGTVLAEPTYMEATQFNEGLAWVVSEDGCPTAIDTKGKVQIEAKEAHHVRCFSEGLAAFSVEVEPHQYLWGFMNTSGKVVIEPQFESVGDFSEGLAAVEMGMGIDFIDKNGKRVITGFPSYEKQSFHNDRIVAEKNEQFTFKTLYDKKGKEVLTTDYVEIYPDGELFYFEALDHQGWMDKNGKVVLKIDLDKQVGAFGDADLALFFKDGKFGYINRKGKEAIPAQFERAFPFSGGHAVVMKDRHIGVINEKGEFTVEPKFDHGTKYYSALDVYGSVVETYPETVNGVTTRYIDPELLANTQITSKGVGPIKINMKLSDIPKSVKYLYDSVVVEHNDNDNDEMVGFRATATFYQKGRPLFGARSWDGKTIGSIGVGFDQRSGVVNPIYFQADERRLHLKDSFKSYISDHNLKKTTVQSSGGPVSYYELQGLKVYTGWTGAIEQFEIGEYLILWD